MLVATAAIAANNDSDIASNHPWCGVSCAPPGNSQVLDALVATAATDDNNEVLDATAANNDTNEVLDASFATAADNYTNEVLDALIATAANNDRVCVILRLISLDVAGMM